MNHNPITSAKILQSALPYMQQHAGRTVVIKYGGHAMSNPDLALSFARDIALMQQVGVNPIIVHGGGPQIGAALAQKNIKPQFIEGLRVTDAATMEVVEMVLTGRLNKDIALSINRAGGRAVGICGKDANLVRARKRAGADIGFVGEPRLVDPSLLTAFETTGLIPVIAPVAADETGQSYNINADTMAGAIATAIGASRLLMLTDVEGVLDKEGKLITQLELQQIETLKTQGVIKGGMIPKIDTCVKSVGSGVDAAVIIDGRRENALILELFTDHGAGTLIKAG